MSVDIHLGGTCVEIEIEAYSGSAILGAYHSSALMPGIRSFSNMSTMKVIRFYPPGGPEKLKYQDEEIPTPGKGEVLIKVHAVGVIWTELIWPIYRDKQGEYISHIPGHDFSGIVEAVGPECTKFEVGSAVYAFSSRRKREGALAEYALADEDQILMKPRNINFIESACIPLSALTAWQAVHDHGKLQKGQRFLVTAGAGGTGIWAVQFAKLLGAHVIATGSSTRSRELMEKLGVDEFVDYKQTGLEMKDVDLVLDCVGGPVLDQCFKALKKGGRLVSINTYDIKGANAVFFIVEMRADQLCDITKMLESGIIQPVVDSVYPLEKTQAAFEYAEAGHVHGKVVISV